MKQVRAECVSTGDMFYEGYSCFVPWQNIMYIFGGYFNLTRESTVGVYANIRRLNSINFRIQDVGQLPFQHNRGACTNMNDEFLFLCFDYKSSGICRQATDPKKFEGNKAINSPYFSHKLIHTPSSESKLSIYLLTL